MYQLFVGTTCV